ncbi:MAG: N-formylglutamate amidohydrolase [Polyangiaceae bacterium]|nr:N-formylglutamate amidohydrolase [Polyangiaceae bacterium]
MLLSHEPPPFEIVCPEGGSRIVLVCDHASHRLPEAVGTLGISQADLVSHIGWDIGAARVARLLSESLNAPLVLSGYSRLVVDCNRPTHVPSAFPETSGGVTVPGNQALTVEQKQLRVNTFHTPYHQAIERTLVEQAKRLAPVKPILLAVHSFTPELLGQKRPWNIGLLYGSDGRLAHRFLAKLQRDPLLTVGDNLPYHVSETTDYTIPVHGIQKGILHTALEIRQNGIDTDAGVIEWAARIGGICKEILNELGKNAD